MENTVYKQEEQKIKYSKIISSLFCSSSIIILSFLCLLNNFSIDLYTTMILLKVVIPASFCFWFIGFVIGKILDGLNVEIAVKKITEEKKAYEIPSMFASDEGYSNDGLDILWKKLILTELNL